MQLRYWTYSNRLSLFHGVFEEQRLLHVIMHLSLGNISLCIDVYAKNGNGLSDQVLCAFGIRTKVEHQAGSTVKLNPHMFSFTVRLFNIPAFQGSLKLDRLNSLNHLYKQVLSIHMV